MSATGALPVWLTSIRPEVDEDLGYFVTTSVYNAVSSNNVTGTASLKYDPDAGDTIITPRYLANVLGGAALTIHDFENSADMQVPVGKKWTAILSVRGTSAGFGTAKIRGSTAADTADGTVHYTIGNPINSSATGTSNVITFAAGEYVTLEAITNGMEFFSGIIVESTA